MQIAIDVENPFNFADVDHDLDSFSKRLHDETLAGSYTPDSNGGSSRDKIVVAALEPVWKLSRRPPRHRRDA